MSARVHHLNCATLCPLGGARLYGAASLVCHCLLIEGPGGLTLVDTGLGQGDLAEPRGRLGGTFMTLLRPALLPHETAAAQVVRLGFAPGDVRDIVLTHLDPDHAGGLADFPHARVHVYAPELARAETPRTFRTRLRYRPEQWAHGPKWVPHPTAGERWFGFESVRALAEGAAEILLVPLEGHTHGHAGVAVRTGGGWLLHCGDAYFFHGEIEEQPHCPRGLLAVQRFDDEDHRRRVANQARLRALKLGHGHEVELFCAHDAHELPR